MRKILFIVATSLIAVAPAAANAQATTSQPQPIVVTGSKGPDANKIVCKSQETIGSRLGAKKVCMTVQEWKEQADFYRDQTETWQRQSPARSSGD